MGRPGPEFGYVMMMMMISTDTTLTINGVGRMKSWLSVAGGLQ
jgi:hypothetical protein